MVVGLFSIAPTINLAGQIRRHLGMELDTKTKIC